MLDELRSKFCKMSGYTEGHKHKSSSTKDRLKQKKYTVHLLVTVLEWTSKSDLNPIEKAVHARKPTSIPELKLFGGIG